MALITTINSLGQQATMTGKQFSPGRRIYLDKEGNAVEADNPKRLTLLCPAHGSIPMADAIRLGLASEPVAIPIETDTKKPEPIEVKVEAEADTKEEPKGKDKAVKPKATKDG